MPGGNRTATYAVNLSCGMEKVFTDKKQRHMWVKLHKTRCEICKNQEVLVAEATIPARRHNINDNQRIVQETAEAHSLLSLLT